MHRRELLRLLRRCGTVVLAGDAFGVASVHIAYAARKRVAITQSTYGSSRQQRPLIEFNSDPAPSTVLIVGGIHAGSETNTVTLVQELLDAAQADPTITPRSLSLTFLTSANPDGLANGMRTLANGIDPNRNWPTDDWAPDTYITGPTLVPGGGGPFPLSEPETQALAALVTQLRPALIVSYHSAAALVTGGPQARALGLEATYADVAGYAAGNWTAYPVTGDFAQWAEQRQHIPTVEVELPDHESTDFDANIAALRATLTRFASAQ